MIFWIHMSRDLVFQLTVELILVAITDSYFAGLYVAKFSSITTFTFHHHKKRSSHLFLHSFNYSSHDWHFQISYSPRGGMNSSSRVPGLDPTTEVPRSLLICRHTRARLWLMILLKGASMRLGTLTTLEMDDWHIYFNWTNFTLR